MMLRFLALALKRRSDKEKRENRHRVGDSIGQKRESLAECKEQTGERWPTERGRPLHHFILRNRSRQLLLSDHLAQAGGVGQIEENRQRPLCKRCYVKLINCQVVEGKGQRNACQDQEAA